jgi:hypothetical protein
VVAIDILHQLNLLLLQTLQLLPAFLLLLPYFDDSLGLLSIYIGELVLPKLHITFFGRSGLFCDFALLLSLHGDEHIFHFFQFLVMFLGDIFDLPSVIEFDQIDGFLYILQFLLVTSPEVLISPPEKFESVLLYRAILFFLNEGKSTYCCILWTSTFF